MRKLRPGVERAWRRIQFYAKVHKAFSKTIPLLVENFYAESPFQNRLREKR